MKLNELPRNGKIHVNIDKSFRYGKDNFPIFISVSVNDTTTYKLQSLEFKEFEFGSMSIDELIFLSFDSCQVLIDDLYRAGFRPSDEIKKDDLINTLKDEIRKRDGLITNLLNQYCLKGENTILSRNIVT